MKGSYSVNADVESSGYYNRPEQRRHQAKVKEAIRRHLADMVTDEHILVSDGRRTLAIPIPELKEFRIRFDSRSQESVGHAGRSGGAASGANDPGKERSPLGGDQPGLDLEETDVSWEDVQEAVFSQLELPYLDPAKRSRGTSRTEQPLSIGPSGIMAQWDRRRTLKAAMLRQARDPRAIGGLMRDDLRFRQYEAAIDDEGGAVVIAMMDTSGSMGSFEKYLAKSFFYWTAEFLRQKYPFVDLVFLAHDVRAREVDEDTFFHRGASGGTVSSSVYRLALDVIQKRFSPDRYNVYAFHFTDGGNLTSDNGLAVDMGRELSGRVAFFGYGEIHDTERNPSPLYEEFAKVPGLGVVILHEKEDIFRAMVRFFGRVELGYAHA
ncbi:MAG: DUF444 domain-containing protein [Sulfobacillus acidophilus]|uniref:DUF444 domain-containing protein n=1 Tax=Sulfobacillus acidophilus TaxID=53633 RepID=A0A2T2WDR2_9FIRM|nr:MAG: DUF444 domain-containing protein [Sulfobacillus acidophilus]